MESDAILKKKRYISAFIAFLLIFISAFSGCGSKDEAENIKSTKENKPSVSTSEKSSVITSVKKDNTTGTTEKITTESKPKPKTEIKTEKETGAETVTKARTETVTATKTKTTVKTEKATKSSKKSEETYESYSSEFFDDAVFVGDSVTMGLRNYVTSERNKGHDCLGKARFLTAGSMGYSNTLPKIGTQNSIHPKYKGKEMYIEDALALMKAKKVFIMLGMNDFCIYSVKDGIGNAEKCINKIKDKNPGIEIYIESVTPALRDKGNFSNANINKFNAALKTFCEENGYTYVDVASAMKNSNGALIKSYCSDPEGRGVHMTYEGCRAWVNYLNKTYSEEK